MGLAWRVIPYPVFGCLLFYVTDPSQRTIGCLKKEYEPTGGAYDQSLGCAVYRFRETSDELVKQRSRRDPLVLFGAILLLLLLYYYIISLYYYYIFTMLLLYYYYYIIFSCIFASSTPEFAGVMVYRTFIWAWHLRGRNPVNTQPI